MCVYDCARCFFARSFERVCARVCFRACVCTSVFSSVCVRECVCKRVGARVCFQACVCESVFSWLKWRVGFVYVNILLTSRRRSWCVTSMCKKRHTCLNINPGKHLPVTDISPGRPTQSSSFTNGALHQPRDEIKTIKKNRPSIVPAKKHCKKKNPKAWQHENCFDNNLPLMDKNQEKVRVAGQKRNSMAFVM